MVNYSLTITLPGVLDGIIQGEYCHKCRDTLVFSGLAYGKYDIATQMIADCARCKLQQSIEGQAHLRMSQ